MKSIPLSIEAEQAVLGAILINNEAFYRIADWLDPEDFTEKVHGLIYEVCGQLIRIDRAATPATVGQFLPENQRVGDMTLQQYLARLAAEAIGIAMAADYAQTIVDLAMRRRLMGVGEAMIDAARNAGPAETPESQIDIAERELGKLARRRRSQEGFQTFEETLAETIDTAAAAYKRDSHLMGLPTGLNDLDQLMGGLQATDLILLAGRPGMGKTALATNIAYATARRDETVAFFSLEMSAGQLTMRIIADRTGISSSNIRRGRITESEFSQIVDAAKEVQKIPLFIDQAGGIDIDQLTSRAKRLKRQRGLGLVVVDYIQLLHAGGRRPDSRAQEVNEITNGLKRLAKDLDVPVLALSQISRQVDSRENKRPQLADLRDSGSLEQDADVVLFVFREEYYLRNGEPPAGSTEHQKWQDALVRAHGIAEIIVGKQRHGPTGSIRAHFNDKLTRFADLAQRDKLPEEFAF